MTAGVYMPLLLSLFAAIPARLVADRMEPERATWLLTVFAVVFAGGGTFALAALTATLIGRLPLSAAAGHWSAEAFRRHDPIWIPIAAAAGLLLCAAVTAVGRGAVRRVRMLIAATRTTRALPRTGRLAVLDDPAPHAYTVPGRIVVSTGMLDALDERERQVLIAHEHAHLARSHYLFVTLAQIAATANPLLRPVAAAVRYTVERWADEHAARHVGDRRLAARTVGKAALLTTSTRPAVLPMATGEARTTGPVPRRIAALLAPPPGRQPLLLAAVLTLLIIAIAGTLAAAWDLHLLFQLAQTATR